MGKTVICSGKKKESYGRGGQSFKVSSEASADLSLASTVLPFHRRMGENYHLRDRCGKEI